MPPGLWQRLRYTLWAPHYDRVTKFHAERRRSIALLGLAAGERVLLVGCGTGADLPFLPSDVSILATDYTRAMLDQARAHARPNVEFRQMDGRALDLPDGSFDAAILHMVLEVVPEPHRCLAEVARVLKPGGRAAVFDKFLPDGARPAWPRRAALALLDTVFTATNRQLSAILAASRAPLTVVHDEPAGGAYRYVLLRKYPSPR
jgi:phosphatidylethanolamine/phosphatidyl-N-methylethanolamine N-methyltransferase